jgi:hypothetical protein
VSRAKKLKVTKSRRGGCINNTANRVEIAFLHANFFSKYMVTLTKYLSNELSS